MVFANNLLTYQVERLLLLHHRGSLVKMRRSIYMMTLKGQFQNLTSGQGHMVTQVGHIAYESMRLDETNTLVPFSRFYLISIKSYWQQTIGDLG